TAAVGHAQHAPAIFVGITLPELREQKGRLANEADEILKKAAAENRTDLRKEEEDKFDAIHADIEKLSGTIKRLEKQEATMASLTESAGRRSDPNPVETRGTQSRGSVGQASEHDRVEGLRAWMTAGVAGNEPTDAQRASARRAGIN